MDVKNFGLEDILDVQQLQKLQDSFSNANGVMCLIVDRDLHPLTTPAHTDGFCHLADASEAGRDICRKTQDALVRDVLKTKKSVPRKCPLSGLYSVAIPLKYEKQILAFWIIAQLKIEEPSDSILKKAALKIDTEYPKLKALIADHPTITRQHFEDLITFVEVLAQNLIALGKSNRDLENSHLELQKANEHIQTSNRMLRLFFDSTDVALYVSDFYTGEVLLVNNRYQQFTGKTDSDITHSYCWELGSKGYTDFCPHCLREKLLDENGKPGKPYRWENYNEQFNTWLRITNQAIYWGDGRLAHMVTFWDITQERLMRDELARLAFYDPQMELPNFVKLTQDIDTLKFRNQEDHAFLVTFDIVSMHRLNDAYGRNVVDEMLRSIVTWLQNKAYQNATIYRVEGDQFSVLLTDTVQAVALQVAKDIEGRFSEAWVVSMGPEEVSLLCNASISVICVRAATQGENPQNLIERTMDLSRREGQIVLYTEELDREAKKKLRLEMSLKACVNHEMEGFSLCFQPIVDPAAGRWYALEALCRWDSPELGPVSPLVFVHEAEQLGLMGQIGFWVLETAVRYCTEWKLNEMDPFMLSVNLSPLQLLDETFPTRVQQLLKKYQFPGEKLNLEITESAELNFNDFSLGIIENLRFHGISIALDDFGTGYSSFNSLKNLPVRFLKTERAFIEGIETDKYMQYFFYIMSELAHATDMKLIAEGVETREQLDIILKNGADYVQGYYFSKPLPPEELAQKLDSFTHINPDFYSLQPPIFEPHEFLGGNASYSITPRLFNVMNRCMQILLSEEHYETAVEEVLALLGESLAVGRTNIYQMEENPPRLVCTHKWFVRDSVFFHDHLDDILLEPNGKEWLRLLEEDGMLVTSDIQTLPDAIVSELSCLDIKAMALLPLFDDEHVVGFIGLDSLRYRDWLPEEIITVRNLAMIMSASLKREKLRAEVQRRGLIFSEVMNRMSLYIFVADPVTKELLWANDYSKTMFRLPEVYEGKHCYELVRGKKSTCVDCQAELLLNNPDIKQSTREYFNNRLGRYFLICDSLVPWENGQQALLQYSIDITETKKAQKELEYYSTIDDLTGTLNRKSLRIALKAMLKAAEERQVPLSVVVLDFNNLKDVNHTYGHVFGDHLLNAMVQSVRTIVRREDVLGRFGYDEFVLVMSNFTKEQAIERTNVARSLLQNQHFEPAPDKTFSFSYGVAESTEIICSEPDDFLQELLSLAEQRMRNQFSMLHS